MRGDRIKPGQLGRKLASLDVDEGIRIERNGRKIFVNRNPSGVFIVQMGDSADFRYFDSAGQVVRFAEAEFGRQPVAWAY